MKIGNHFWVKRRLPENRACFWRLGPLRLWIVRMEGHWRIAAERGETNVMETSIVPLDVVPGHLEWTVFAAPKGAEEFECAPRLPDRPLVLRGDSKLVVPSKCSIEFFVRVPLWVEVRVVGGKEPITLATFPTRVFSDTWFGDPQNGELCYSLWVPAQIRPEDLDPGPHHAVWPGKVENHSKTELQLERVCIRPMHVSLYSGRNHHWCSEVTISFSGTSQVSEVSYNDMAPPFEEDLREVLPPEQPISGNILQRSLSALHRYHLV